MQTWAHADMLYCRKSAVGSGETNMSVSKAHGNSDRGNTSSYWHVSIKVRWQARRPSSKETQISTLPVRLPPRFDFLFQTFVLFWMLHSFFWVNPQRLNFMLPTFRNNKFVPSSQAAFTPPIKMDQSIPKRRHIKFRRWGFTQKKEYNKFWFVKKKLWH